MTNRFPPLNERGPLRAMFIISSMPVGGAETLLVNLIRRLDRDCIVPELSCLGEAGPLGEMLASEIPVHTGILRHKYDVSVLPRLARLLRERKIDAVVTVGAGDKMFWGRLAARAAGLPVAISALHSTGWPDGVGRLNRILTPLTSAFIGVAEEHGRYLIDNERFPAAKVHVIPNGVDVDRFAPRPMSKHLQAELGLRPAAPVVGIVAVLRPEKNHELFLQAASLVRDQVQDAQFLIVGDGERRAALEQMTAELGLRDAVRFAGSRNDIPDVLSLIDVFALTSHMEANPVSILEAMAVGKPVVATRVGSVPESVKDGQTGFLVAPGNAAELAQHIATLLEHPHEARALGAAARSEVVQNWSLQRMVSGYEDLIRELYCTRCGEGDATSATPAECDMAHML